MSFVRHRGKVKTIWMEKKASTDFSKGALVSMGTGGDAGLVIPATSSTTALSHMGVIQRDVASTDDDYADESRVPIRVPLEKNVEWKAPVNGTATDSIKGTEIDLTDSVTLNEAATSVNVALVREIIDGSNVTVLLKLNGSY